MGNPASALIRVEIDKVRKEANARGIKSAPHYVRRKKDIGAAINAIKKKQLKEGGVHAIFVCTDPFVDKSAPRSQGGTESRLADRSRIS